MQERHGHLISICFATVMITIMSIFVQNSVATSNSTQNDSVTISDPDIPQPISSGSTNLRIFASFYPISDFVEKIGKDKVDV
jgi:zinc transport system substrate-binding protein